MLRPLTAQGWRTVSHTALSQRQCLLTLAIESSCDDTAVAILEKRGSRATLHFNEKVTSNNALFKGIHPLVSLESHRMHLANLIAKAMKHLPRPDPGNEDDHALIGGRRRPDFVSVTRGPGMMSCLATGLDTAKGLAVAWQIPLLGVHHMQAHALTPRLQNALERIQDIAEGDTGVLAPDLPFLSLLVSGGHTLLLRSTSLVEHEILASTVDIAVGDCLDKVARAILPAELLYGATKPMPGPILEKFAWPEGSPADYDYTAPGSRGEEITRAQTPSPYGWRIPPPYLMGEGGRKYKEMKFSLVGLGTLVRTICEKGWDHEKDRLSHVDRTSPIPEDEARHLAREAMRVIFEHLASRILLALQTEKETGIASKTVVLSGGVAANMYLRHVTQNYLATRGFPDIKIVAPPVALCTDNAAMIAWTACEMYEAGYQSSLEIRALRKWSLPNLLHPEREQDGRDVIEVEHEKHQLKLQPKLGD